GLRVGLIAAALALATVIAHWRLGEVGGSAGAYLTRGVVFSAIPPLIAWAGQSPPQAHAEELAPHAALSVAASRELSLRECEVLQLLALGYTNPEIATQLIISVRTVEGHRARLQRKLGVSSRAELVRFALDRGVLH